MLKIKTDLRIPKRTQKGEMDNISMRLDQHKRSNFKNKLMS